MHWLSKVGYALLAVISGWVFPLVLLQHNTPSPLAEDSSSFLQIATTGFRAHKLTGSTKGSVPTIVLDSEGTAMPRVAMGTWPQSLPRNITSSELTNALLSWISLGGRHIDTAYFYEVQQPFNQKAVGQAIAKGIADGLVERGEVFVTSKVNGPIGYKAAKSQVLGKTMPHLGLEYIDLLLLHWPCATLFGLFGSPECGDELIPARVDTWRALEELRADGVVKNIGISNFKVDQLESFFAAVKEQTGHLPNVTVSQIDFSVTNHDDALLEWCQQHHITVEAYSPLGGRASGLSAMEAPPVIAAAKAHNVSSAQVAMRWILQKDVVVIASSANEAHQAEDLSPLFDFSLTTEEMTALDRFPHTADEIVQR